jgi:hypothetical protein
VSPVQEWDGEGLYKSFSGHEPTERYLLGMIRVLERRYRDVLRSLARHLERWVDDALTRRMSDHPDEIVLKRALPGIQLTSVQINELAALVEAHFSPAGILAAGPSWGIPEETWDRWKVLGIVPGAMDVPEFHDAYQAGRLYQVIRDGDSYEEMRRLAMRIPQTRAAQIAADWSAEHSAQEIKHFGQGLGQQAADAALSLNHQAARAMISAYQAGALTHRLVPPGPAHDMTDAEREALDTGKLVQDWRGLSRELYKRFAGQEAERDWARVANTEVALNHNVGRLGAIAQSGPKTQLYYLVQPGACEHCRKIYLHKDGTPIIFTVQEIEHNLAETGGLNVGRKASLIGREGGWIACGGPIHPWCRCKPVVKLPDVAPTVLGT